jgi:outer membrane protein
MQFFKTSLALAVLLAAGAAQAQTAGSILLSGGVMNITPDVTSDDITAPGLPGSKIASGGSTRPGGSMAYMLTDHWAVDVPLALPFKHTITGDGAVAGVGKVGEIQVLPMTLLGQYRFNPAEAKFRPYLGAGLTYAKFFKERGTGTMTGLTGGTSSVPTTFSLQSKLALTLQVGATVALNERWFVNGMVAKTFLKTRATFSTGQTVDVTLDPLTVCFGVGYRF